MNPQHGPSPDDQNDLAEEVARLVARRLRREPEIRIEGYSEGVDKDRRTWRVGVAITLTAAALLGAWKYSNDMTALQTKVTDLIERVDHMEKIIEPRYRGSP